jgi:hypothetical protein
MRVNIAKILPENQHNEIGCPEKRKKLAMNHQVEV